jgi:PAS domain S-box-containing protein
MERFDLLINNFNSLSKELETIREQLKSESEEFFNTIVEYSPNFIAIAQKEKYVFVNAHGLELLRCRSSADIIGKEVIDTIHPDYRNIVISRLSKAESEPNKPVQIKVVRTDGTVFDSESNSVPFLYNKKPAVLIIGHDITSEKGQKEIIQKEQQLRTDILNSFSEVVAFYDPRHKIKWINKAGMQQLGLTDNSYIGENCYKIWFGNKGPCPNCPVVTKNMKPSERLVTFSDESIWLVRHIPMFDFGNDLTGYIEFRENVTEKEKIKQELEKSRGRLIKAELAASFGHFEYDLNKRTEVWSHGAYHILGLSYNIAPLHEHHDFMKYIHPDDLKRVIYFLNQSVTEYSKFDQVFRIYNASGDIKIIRGRGEVIEDIEKNTKFFFGTVQDMTKELELEKKNKQLAADSLYVTQKNKILHEIETELNNVLSRKETFQKKDFQNIIDIIGSYSKFDKDWDLLKSHFEEIHSSFFDKLKGTHSALTSNDLKHCACIKLNFSTKEIAKFFNIKASSVQIARVRLKKKMNLPESAELRNYILTFQ